MPELPDLLYIQEYARKHFCGKSIVSADVKQPVVLRVAIDASFEASLLKKEISDCVLNGPFLNFVLSGDLDLVMNLMLAGKLQHQFPNDKPEGHLCFSLRLDDGSRMNLCDEQKMAKAYLVPHGEYNRIPKYSDQGINVRSSDFTLERFKDLAKKNSRKQVRVFINDHTTLSSIGNAYADEILFDAGIHPKTFIPRLSEADLQRLHTSIRNVMEWGIDQVTAAGAPIHIKVRDHMKVRNRKGEPCPRCGTTIRREGVRGFDVFFCPKCQPSTRKSFIDWNGKNSDLES